MNEQTRRDIFNQDDAIAAQWSELFEAQIDASFPFEVSAFFRSSAWHAAKRVLDVGTGDGYFAAKLAGVFGGKLYCGVDRSERLILRARRRALPLTDFICQDVYVGLPRAEFVIMRAFAQHQQDFEVLLKTVAEAVGGGGAIMLIDRDDQDPVWFWPPAPLMRGFYDIIAQTQRRRRGAHNLRELIRIAKNSGSWSVAQNERIVVPSTVGDGLRLLSSQFSLMLRLFRNLDHGLPIDFPYESLEREWGAWCRHPHRYCQKALRIVELVRSA